MVKRAAESSEEEDEYRKRQHVSNNESVEEEEGSSEYESDEEDDDYESIKMTQKQYDDYVVNISTGYRSLTDNLQSHRSKVARDGSIVSVQTSLNKANSLYENFNKIGDSHYKNEITNLDSRAIREIGEQASIGVSNIDLGVTDKGLDVDEFVVRFARYAKHDSRIRRAEDDDDDSNLFFDGAESDQWMQQEVYESFNWNKLSALYMKHSSKIPTIDFMLGPLDVEFKKRKVNRVEKDYLKTGRAVRPSQVQVEDIINNQEKDTYKSAIHCFQILQEKEEDKPINLFKFFINPDSFSQSIENLFYTSFLINHNKLILYKGADGIPLIKVQESGDAIPKYIASSKNPENKSHLIFKLEYDTWLKLIELYDIKSPFLGNRKSTITY